MSTKEKRKKKHKGKGKHAAVRDKHLLYSAAVQSLEADLDFFDKTYKKQNGKKPRLFREDFCGTAALACEWVRRNKKNRAWGIDLDRPTLDWGIERYVPRLESAADRLELLCQDVRDPVKESVEVIAALNFSFQVFKTRDALREYFASVRKSLVPGGMFYLDAFGGTGAMSEDYEERKVPGSKAFDGTKIPPFTYCWEQKRFNTVDNHIECRIHFKLKDGTKLNKAFQYEWRLWSLPELQELMLEAGFEAAKVYLEGWDDKEDDTDGVFRHRTYYENQEGWVAYVVGTT